MLPYPKPFQEGEGPQSERVVIRLSLWERPAEGRVRVLALLEVSIEIGCESK